MAKCRDCKNYQPIDDKKGTCFGVEIDSNTDPKTVEKCQEKYLQPRQLSEEGS